MRNKKFSIALLLIGLLALMPGMQTARAQSEEPVVHAVLIYSPTCGHCHYVITEVLPPLFEKYGNQLQIIGVDASSEQGYNIFLSVIVYFQLDKAGVPFLIIGDQYLIGSTDIPEKLPGLIELYLAQGGVDWPDIPGLMEGIMATPLPTETATITPVPMEILPTPTGETIAITPTLAIVTPTPTSTPGLLLSSEHETGLSATLKRDPVGNSLAIVVLVGMFAALLASGFLFLRGNIPPHASRSGWIIPLLSLIGMGGAAYLAYIEITQVEAICGPVGDCNTVQQSEYARLFGILPIGLLGLVGYVMILAAWATQQFSKGKLADCGALGMLFTTTFGTIFSIYLTFLEPFVIGATCAWCLTSAVVMTILMLLSIAPGKLAFRNMTKRNQLSRTFGAQR